MRNYVHKLAMIHSVNEPSLGSKAVSTQEIYFVIHTYLFDRPPPPKYHRFPLSKPQKTLVFPIVPTFPQKFIILGTHFKTRLHK